MKLLLLCVALLSLGSAQTAAILFSNSTCESGNPGCEDDGCGTLLLCFTVNSCFNYGGGLYNSRKVLIGSMAYMHTNNPNVFTMHYYNLTDCNGPMGVTNFNKGQDCEDP